MEKGGRGGYSKERPKEWDSLHVWLICRVLKGYELRTNYVPNIKPCVLNAGDKILRSGGT